MVLFALAKARMQAWRQVRFLARAWCSSTSPAIGSRAGRRCCRRKCVSIAPRDARTLARVRRDYKIDAVQVEYTALAPYRGDVLVEHDVTFSLYDQVRGVSGRSGLVGLLPLAALRAQMGPPLRVRCCDVRGRPLLLGSSNVTVVPNGVDLERFRPEMERPGHRLLFHRFLSSFSEHRRVPVLYGAGLAAAQRTGRRGASDRCGRTRSAALLARTYGIIDLPHDERLRAGVRQRCTAAVCRDQHRAGSDAGLRGHNLKVLEALAMDRRWF